MGYWSFDCCNGSCDSCKNINLPEIRSLSNKTLVKYFQFEVVETEYKSKKTGELKATKRTERVQKKASIADLVDEFIDMTNDYLVHRYQTENDKFQ